MAAVPEAGDVRGAWRGSPPLSECLTLAELETLARASLEAGEPSDHPHLTACETCRVRLSEVRSNLVLFEECLQADTDSSASDGSSESALDWIGLTPSQAERVWDQPPAIEGYDIIEEVHHGSQGVIYRATQQRANRVVALKVLLRGPYASRRERRRFEREVDLVAGLTHPSIVRLYDSGRAGPFHYFAMEYIEGLTLDDYVQVKRLDVRSTLRLFTRVCRAVAHAHSRGIIHRDLKPNNIRVDAEGEPHVLDFGLAKPLGTGATETLATRAGEFFGTLAYASPEQISGKPQTVDTRSDVYALGMILYKLLTGRAPYDVTGSITEVVRNINDIEPQRPSHLNPDINDEVDTIVRKALAKDPAHRYQTASEMSDDIERYLKGLPIHAKPYSAAYSLRKAIGRHKTLAALVGSLLVSLVGFLALLTVHSQRLAVERDRAVAAEYLAQRNLYLSRINLAFNAIEKDDTAKLKQMLAACPPELRGWEWYRLKWLSDRSLVTFKGHVGDVFPVIVSPDDRWVASLSHTDGVRVWELLTGRQQFHIPGITRNGSTFRFARDASMLAVALADGSVAVHRVPSGQTVFTAPFEGIEQVRFAAEDRVVLAIADHRARAWRLADGRLVLSANGPDDSETYSCIGPGRRYVLTWRDEDAILVRDLADGTASFERTWPETTWSDFAPNGEWIAASGRNGLAVWRRDGGELVASLRPKDGTFASCEFCETGRRLLVRDDGGTLTVVELPAGRIVRTIALQGCLVASLSPDGTELVAADPHRIRHWHVDSGKLLTKIHTTVKPGMALALGPNGRRLELFVPGRAYRRMWRPVTGVPITYEDLAPTERATFRQDMYETTSPAHLRRYVDLATGRRETILRGHVGEIRSECATSDARYLVTASEDDTCKVWDMTACTDQLTWLSGQAPQYAVFSPDGSEIIAALRDSANNVAIFDATQPGPPKRTFTACPQSLTVVDLSSDGAKILAAPAKIGPDCAPVILDARTGERLQALQGHTEGIAAAAFTPDGRRAVTGSWDGTIRIWDVATGQERHRLVHEEEVWDLAVSPDGQWIASGDAKAGVYLWQTDSGRLERRLQGHTDEIDALAFSSDGLRLVSGDNDGTLICWDLAENKPVWTHSTHRPKVYSAIFTPDGERIITGGRNTVSIWQARTGRLVDTVIAHGGSVFSLDFTPDGCRLLTIGESFIKVWPTAPME